MDRYKEYLKFVDLPNSPLVNEDIRAVARARLKKHYFKLVLVCLVMYSPSVLIAQAAGSSSGSTLTQSLIGALIYLVLSPLFYGAQVVFFNCYLFDSVDFRILGCFLKDGLWLKCMGFYSVWIVLNFLSTVVSISPSLSLVYLLISCATFYFFLRLFLVPFILSTYDSLPFSQVFRMSFLRTRGNAGRQLGMMFTTIWPVIIGIVILVIVWFSIWGATVSPLMTVFVFLAVAAAYPYYLISAAGLGHVILLISHMKRQ